jgi:hypothetical protein
MEFKAPLLDLNVSGQLSQKTDLVKNEQDNANQYQQDPNGDQHFADASKHNMQRDLSNHTLPSALNFVLFEITLLFAEDTSAVFLAVQIQFLGFVLPFVKSRSKIPIDEVYTQIFSDSYPNLPDQFMFLIGTDQKRSSKGIKAFLDCPIGCLNQSYLIAKAAAVLHIIYDCLQIFLQIVRIIVKHGKWFERFECLDRIQSALVFGERMDIGIIPKP